MPFTDSHIYYPHELSDDDVIARVEAVLTRSPNVDALMDPRDGLAHGIWRWCLEYDLNPAWPLVSMQRERSLLGKLATSPSDFMYAFGYVGKDGPGTVNKRWNGLIPQAWLCIHQSAWIAGLGAPECYAVRRNLRPHAARWTPSAPTPIQLYGAPGEPTHTVTPTSMKQHVILTYTPHAEAEVRADQLLHQFVPEFE